MYTKRIDRTSPGCVLFLVDRSWSMSQPTADGTTLASGVAGAVNKLIFELVLRSISDPTSGPRHYYDVGVIGYGQSAHRDAESVESAFAGRSGVLRSVPELADNPLRIEERPMTGRTNDGGTVRTPVWIDPLAGYSTPMCAALELAGRTVYDWIVEHPDSFPPIVINITDGAVTDRGSDNAGLYEWARRVRDLSTSDGNVLFFNVFLSATPAVSTFFPAAATNLPQPEGTDLFEISSELPAYMAALAFEAGHATAPHARGLAFNADLSALVGFLRIGTSVVPQLVR